MGGTVGRLLARGNVAEVFEWGERVLKLYRDPAKKPAAFREAATHAAVEALGLPVPAVWGVPEAEGRWGVLFDRAGRETFADRMRAEPSAAPRLLGELAALQTRIHAHPATGFLPLKDRLAGRIARAEHLDGAHREALLTGLAGMPDGDRLCHGDFHPGNVLGEPARPVVIDWPDASRGDPAADICRSHLLLRLHAGDLARPYLDACCRVGGLPPRAVLAWLPYLAGARLAEDIPGELDLLSGFVRRAHSPGRKR